MGGMHCPLLYRRVSGVAGFRSSARPWQTGRSWQVEAALPGVGGYSTAPRLGTQSAVYRFQASVGGDEGDDPAVCVCLENFDWGQTVQRGSRALRA